MAITHMLGMESAAVGTEGLGALTGTIAFSTTHARTGTRSLRVNPASGASGSSSAGTVSRWVHFGLYVATMPSVSRIIMGSSTGGNVKLNSDGTLTVADGASAIGTSAVALGTGTWYWIGWRNAVSVTGVLLQIDGVDAVSGTSASGASSTIGCPGTEASAIDVYFDDFIYDDAGYIAPSKVNLALPISDNTRTGVTTGNGGTTNLWDAVDNTPPAGVASASETATSNIEYPASTTCDYIANLTTYTNLGVGALDTVLAVQSIVRHGEDINTGTKTMQNCGALTNPTVAGATVTFGEDGGAHGAEVGVWVTAFGTVSTSPSVTLGTSPTIQASRVSQTRVGCIDFMGMYVAWTPSTVARVPKASPYPQILAH